MKFTPFDKYILAKRIDIKETESGLALPNTIKTTTAEIVKMGPGVSYVGLGVGVKVMFFRSTSISLNNEEYLMFTEQDLFGILEEDDCCGDCNCH